jgi:hypothetical protein
MLTDTLREMLQEETEATLDREIGALRAALEVARREVENGECDTGDLAKMGARVARLSDSIVRAVLAQQKLSTGSDPLSRIRAELDHVLRVIES